MKISCHLMGLLLLGSFAPAEEETQELSPLVVEASRGSVLPAFFPGNAHVISSDTIANAGARSLGDLLTNEGGIRITSTSGNSANGEIHLRGFGENSASRVLVMIDGRPINRPDLAAFSLLEVPLSRISKIEILRGSQTARFGNHAVGGVINIITKSPEKPLTSLETAVGSDQYSLLRLSHDGRYQGHGISMDYERNQADGWRDNSGSELESAALRWDHSYRKGLDLKGGISWADEYAEFPGPLSTEEYRQDPRQSIYSQAGQAKFYFSRQQTFGADAALLSVIEPDLTLDLPFSFISRDQAWNLGPGSHTNNLLETLTSSPMLRLTKEKWTLDLGLKLQQDELTLDQFAEISRNTLTGKAMLKRQEAGIFATFEWEPKENWHFNAAGRWQTSKIDASARSFMFPDDESLNFSRWNDEQNQAFQLGLRWEPHINSAIWFRYDHLYRLPSTDEIASYQGFPLTLPFNDQLTAETGFNLELGGEYSLNEWSFRANTFFQQLHGEITYDYVKNLNVNFADTKRLGTELNIGYESKIWNANLNYTWLDARYRDGEFDGKSIFLVPNHELSATAAIRPHPKLTIQSEYQFIGSSYEGNDFANKSDKLPAYGVTNLLLRYQPKNGLSFYFRVNNLLDESYATLKYSGVWYPAAGRSFLGGVRYEF